MSDQNEQLKPAPFELAPNIQSAGDNTTVHAPRWVLPALAGLLLLALAVIFWLPRQVNETDAGKASPAADPAFSESLSQNAASEPSDTISPWSDAQTARLREEAKTALQQLLDLQFALEERAAASWAEEAWTAATATAQSGDALYRQRDYLQAKEKYLQGLQQLQAIEKNIPATVAAQLELAATGLETGLVQQVADALALIEHIEPDNAQLPGLQQRAATLQPLLDRLQAAADAEASDDLNRAEEQLREAVSLDSQHQRAASELQRVSAANGEQQFNRAMSSGYSALDEGDFDQAIKQFGQAASLRPGSAEAGSALAEAEVAQQSARLATIKAEGLKLENSEQWQQAAAAYQQAIAMDSTLLFANEGLKRSQSRARLDQKLRTVIDTPSRLSDQAVAEATARLLQQARKTAPHGPLLQQQIATVERLLQQYNTLIPVNFLSDGETEVIVYKVARLGRFEQTTLKLRPGSYRVRGSRTGYRDVLHTFQVSPRGAAPDISVSCTERIL